MIRYKILLLGLFTASLLTGCGTSKSSVNSANDDLYYTQEDDKNYVSRKEKIAKEKNNKNNDINQDYNSGSGNSANNYYLDDTYNYYDQPYSSRIRRFYGPTTSFGYYDPFYNPGFYGGSMIGMGMGWRMSVGYGYPVCMDPFYCNPMFMPVYPSYYYSPFYSPYYAPYSMYNEGYYRGYRDAGYYNGGAGGGGNFGSGGGINRTSRPRGTNTGTNSIYNNRTISSPGLIKREAPNYNNNNNTNDNYSRPNLPPSRNRNNSTPQQAPQREYSQPRTPSGNTPRQPSGGSGGNRGGGGGKVNRPRN